MKKIINASNHKNRLKALYNLTKPGIRKYPGKRASYGHSIPHNFREYNRHNVDEPVEKDKNYVKIA